MTLTLSRKILVIALLPTLVQIGCFGILLHQFGQEQNYCNRLIGQMRLLMPLQAYNRLMYRGLFSLGAFIGGIDSDSGRNFDDTVSTLRLLVKRMRTALSSDPYCAVLISPFVERLDIYPLRLKEIKDRSTSGPRSHLESSHKFDKSVGSATFYEMHADMSRITRQLRVVEESTERDLEATRRQILNVCMITLFLNLAATSLACGFFHKLVLERLTGIKRLSDGLRENMQMVASSRKEESINSLNWLESRKKLDELDLLKLDLLQITASEHNARLNVDALVSASADAIGIFSTGGELIYGNDKLLGDLGPDTVSQRVIVNGENADVLSVFREVSITGGIKEFDGEFTREPDEGNRSFRAVVLKGSQPNQIFAIFHDVSKLRSVEKLKLEVIDMVRGSLSEPTKRLAERLDRVVAMMELSESEPGQLTLAARNLDKVTELLGELQNIESLEVQSVSIRKEHVQFERLVASCFEVLKPAATQQGVTLSCQSKLTSDDVLADPHALEKIVLNLLSNAIKFSPTGSSVVICSGEVDGQFEFIVEDEGKGIANSELKLIFESYGRSSGETASGSGLGLTVCHMLVEAHGGIIWAENKNEGGARFLVRLPLN